MSERWRSSSSITRRDVVKGAVAVAALGAGSVLTGRDVASSREIGSTPGGDRRRRCGWRRRGLLSGRHPRRRPLRGTSQDRRSLRFARDRLSGKRITVDLGAQFFHPDTHPIYVTLLQHLGLYDPAKPDSDDTLAAPAGLCIFPTAGGPPVFASSNPFATPRRALDFVRFTQLARQAVLSDLPWKTTVESWIRSLPSTSRSRTTSCIRGSRR